MPKFRKLPVEIEAMQVPAPEDGGAWTALAAWLHSPWQKRVWQFDGEGRVVIVTLEGEHLAQRGDWIIRGVHNEIYPCKPDIFAATYEPA